MNTPGILGLLAGFIIALAPLACSGTEASCVDLCEEAQERTCTIIKGNCTNFCEAVFNVEDTSGCADEREAYHDCLESGDVCDERCNPEENAFSSCLGTYCAGNANTPDCRTLLSSI